MRHSIKTGLSFGLTSAVVIGGVLTIAIADSLSDALGIHVSEESEGKHSQKQIWTSTISTFLGKFSIAITFILPLLIWNLSKAIIINVGWGFLLLGIFSYYVVKGKESKSWKVILEHLILASLVILTTHYPGTWISIALS